MMRREALVQGNTEDLSKQLDAPTPAGFSFGHEFAKSILGDKPGTSGEVYDDMSSPLPGLSIAPAGVVGMNSK